MLHGEDLILRGNIMDGMEATAVAPGGATAEGERTPEDLLRLFAGPNPDKFLADYRSRNGGERKRFNLAWPAFFLGFVWFFHRKMFGIGVVMLLIPIAIALLFPTVADKGSIGLGFALAYMGPPAYVWFAQRKIKAIEASGLPVEERDRLIREAGGVSWIGSSVGGLLLVAFLVVAFAPLFLKSELPACDSADIKDLTHRAIMNNLKAQNLSPEGVTIEQFAEVSASDDKADPYRRCAFRLKAPGEDAPLNLMVTWKDRARGEFQVRVIAPDTP